MLYLCKIMKNSVFKILTILIVALSFTGCSDHDDEPDNEQAPRAVLVYMVANNSLGAAKYDSSDLTEMEIAAKQGDFGDSRLFVYHHGRNQQPVLKEITASGERIVTYYNTNQASVSASRMDNVIDDFIKDADAERHGLILWSHGSGWIENGIVENSHSSTQSLSTDSNATAITTKATDNDSAIKPLSFGDDGGRYMNVTTLADVLEGKGFDYIYFDCCYMAGIEVVYELRNCTSQIAASATELPANGMPYDETLKYLLKKDADLVSATRTTFDFYNSKSGQSRTCTISVTDTSALDDLADATRAVYVANNTNTDSFSPQHFMTSSCYIFDFGQYVDDLAASLPELKTNFDNALARAVIYKASTPKLWDRLNLTYHSGLSTYIPGYGNTPNYNYENLQWAREVASALQR